MFKPQKTSNGIETMFKPRFDVLPQDKSVHRWYALLSLTPLGSRHLVTQSLNAAMRALQFWRQNDEVLVSLIGYFFQCTFFHECEDEISWRLKTLMLYTIDLTPHTRVYMASFLFTVLKNCFSENTYNISSSLGRAIPQCLQQMPRECYLVFQYWEKSFGQCGIL